MSDGQMPSMKREGLKNIHHAVNRAAKVLKESGASAATIEDMRSRIISENVRLTLEEALEIVAEYVEIES